MITKTYMLTQEIRSGRRSHIHSFYSKAWEQHLAIICATNSRINKNLKCQRHRSAARGEGGPSKEICRRQHPRHLHLSPTSLSLSVRTKMRPVVTNEERNYSPTLLNRTTIVSQHPLSIIGVMVDTEEDSSGLVASILTRGILKMKCTLKFIRSKAVKMGHFMIPLSLLR